MSKTKTPFLSLGSSGTVGGVLTSQKRGGVTILRSTPKPTDPYSLAQAYQRWDYRDYAYLWTLLTNSQKQVYRTRASRYHITGFSLWMREHLKELPDLAGRWHLDNISGGKVLDSSRNTNHGTVYGASLTKGVIDQALDFDGIDNYINFGTPASINNAISKVFSLEFIFKPSRATGFNQVLLSKYAPGFKLRYEAIKKLLFHIWISPTDSVLYLSTATLEPNYSHHVIITRDFGNKIYFYLNGQQDSVHNDISGDCFSTTIPLRMAHGFGWDSLLGFTDELRIYNRILDATEAKRHSERRYP